MKKNNHYSINYKYDQLNRLVSAANDDSMKYCYVYDQVGNLINISFGDQATQVVEGLSLSPPGDASLDENKLPRWFISRGNQRYGPYSWDDLVSFVPQKRLLKEDFVWCEDWESWVLAETINGLF